MVQFVYNDRRLHGMSTRNSFSKSLQPKPLTVVTSSNTSRNSSTDSLIRIAIDQSAEVGFLYDAKTDSVLNKLQLEITPIRKILQSCVICKMIEIDSLESKNLLHIFGIGGELWVSLMLSITPAGQLNELIDPMFPIDGNTRFITYYYANKELSIDEQKLVAQNISKVLSETTATHLITSIKFGIHALIVVQLPSDDQMECEDSLKIITEKLNNAKFRPSTAQNLSLSKIVSTKIFSNIPDLAKMKSLSDFCQKLYEVNKNSQYGPLECNLRSIKHFDPNYPEEKGQYIGVEKATIDTIQHYLIDWSLETKKLSTHLDAVLKKLLDEDCKHQFDNIQKQIAEEKENHSKEIVRIRDLVCEIRNGTGQQNTSVESLIKESKKSLFEKINLITKDIETLIKQMKPNNDTTQDGVRHLDIETAPIPNDKDSKKSSQNIKEQDRLREMQASSVDAMEGRPHKERNLSITSSPNVTSSSTTESSSLANTTIKSTSTDPLPLVSEITSLASSTNEPSSSLQPIPSAIQNEHSENISHPNLSDTSKVNFINILLLGESGVGKSTFINAFVNYLRFETFEKARSDKPVVLMPVSFLMTVGDNFEERTIKFGDVDSNEDHDHAGQSVTQHCRSYIFPINSQTKLRIIDTPGMGDTRGLTQDDLNMQHILSFINNLPHLNAICILLKPNESKLNIVLRSYFTRLLNFLGENVRKNIVFCFTNTRATFYAPGDTGPLLRVMIDKLPTKGIPFLKSNTFCFDSESFRYLVALQNGIQFETYEEKEYRQSWIKSATESNRLFKYISETLECYSQNEWQSIEHAQFRITQISRPMLETTRNLFRNIILLKKKSSKMVIQLHPSGISPPLAICYNHACKRTPQPYEDFWILPDDLHTISDKCSKCTCGREKHVDVHHRLEYKLSSNKNLDLLNGMNTKLDQLERVILDFASIYAPAAVISMQNDSIFSALMRMISEEEQILSEKETTCLNLTLKNELLDLKEKYTDRRDKSMSTGRSINLPAIYELIKRTTEIDEIKEQMNFVKQSEGNYMDEQERQVSL